MVDAFLAAARDGDFDALLAVLDPDVVLRADTGALTPGASKILVARPRWPSRRSRSRGSASSGARPWSTAPRAWSRPGRQISVMGFTVAGGKIVEIDILADRERLDQLDLIVLDG